MDCFEKNLEFLAHYQPALFKRLRHLTPCRLKASEHIANDLMIEGERFYGMNGKEACHAQVSQFLAHPTHLSLTYKSKAQNGYFHQVAINHLNEKAQAFSYNKQGKPNHTNVIVLGAGLGFHIPLLQECLQVKHLVIVEPNDEMLFHFFHHIDVHKLDAHCKRHGGSLSFLQPNSTLNFANQIRDLSLHIGVGLFSELTLYRHYETPLFDDIHQNVKSLRNKWVSSWGFFNDEFISINNSLKNAAHIQYFTKATHTQLFPPAIIVGNGPSLDSHINTLKNLKGKAIIFSCGSALAPLLRQGITPDFHVEMERSHFTALTQEQWLTPELCQRIPLICLNTVDADITQRFSTTLGFIKANDIGANLLLKCESHVTPLYHCNPTATNLGAASAIALGFTTLLLVGCDFGFTHAMHHHAKQSDYFEKGSLLSNIAPRAEFLVPGENAQQIQTTRVFNIARESIEKLLKRHPEITAYNCSSGAKIQGAEFTSLETLLERLKGQWLNPTELMSHLTLTRITPDTKVINDTLSYYADLSLSIKETFLNLREHHGLTTALAHTIRCLSSPEMKEHAAILYSGSLKYLAIVIEGHLSRIPPRTHHAYCKFAHEEVLRVLERAHEVLVNFIKENKT